MVAMRIDLPVERIDIEPSGHGGIDHLVLRIPLRLLGSERRKVDELLNAIVFERGVCLSLPQNRQRLIGSSHPIANTKAAYRDGYTSAAFENEPTPSSEYPERKEFGSW